MYKRIIAVILLLYSVFGQGLLDGFDKPEPKPEPNPAAEILNIEKPTEQILKDVNVFSDIVSEPSDRAKLAIFNYEFAERVVGYDTSVQQVNDVYSLAGKIFFQRKLVNKYEGLSDNLKRILEKILTEENHLVTPEEKQSLNEYFMGIAWVLIQKG